MFIIEINHPRVGRGYIKQYDYECNDDLQEVAYTDNFLKAHVFVEKNDDNTTEVPWPSDEEVGKEIIKGLSHLNPNRVRVTECEHCASIRPAYKPCLICQKR